MTPLAVRFSSAIHGESLLGKSNHGRDAPPIFSCRQGNQRDRSRHSLEPIVRLRTSRTLRWRAEHRTDRGSIAQ